MGFPRRYTEKAETCGAQTATPQVSAFAHFDFQKQSPFMWSREDCPRWGTWGLITDTSRVGLTPFQGAEAFHPPAELQAHSQDTSREGRVWRYR